MSDVNDDMEIETAVKTLNAHSHRGRTDWRWSDSICEVEVPNHETMHIHPTDAKIIAAYYWHKLNPPSPPPGRVTIHVNGREFSVDNCHVTYEEVVLLTGRDSVPDGITVTYFRAFNDKSGSLQRGQSVICAQHTMFDVSDTSGA